MPKIKVTQKGLEALTAKAHAKRVDYFDSATPGLCLTVGPKSATWFYFARVDGKLVRLKLGEWDATGIADARRLAAAVEEQKAAGRHPKAEQARDRSNLIEARNLDQQRILRSVAELWGSTHVDSLAPRTQRDYRRLLDALVVEFGDRDVESLRRGELIRYLDTVRARSAVTANHMAVVLRLLFAFARDRFDLDASPAADIKTPSKLKKRTRTLDRNEIRVLWHACELAGYPYGHALRLTLCTGQRIGEVGGIRRSDIDSSGDYWKQEDNKSGRRIDIYLASHARAVLDGCPNLGKRAPYFSASTDGEGQPRPLKSDAWNNAIRRHITPQLKPAAEALQLEPITKPWTPHDLRRTVRTALTGWCGVSPDTAERVLNHAMSGLREVYDHADYRPHVAEALQRWDVELGAILKGSTPQVIPLNRARKRRTG